MKKKLTIATGIICAVFVIGIISGAFMLNNGVSISTGIVLISENGTHFLISGNTPVRLSDYSEKNNIFPALENGDKILVLHGAVAESYPASTLCRACIKIGNGNISDIPEEVITSMRELGWINDASEDIMPSGDWENVKITIENANLSLSLPPEWKYTESSNKNGGFSISIYRNNESENNVTVEFMKSFSVCGTGLRTEDATINGYDASIGIYDGNPTFDYVTFVDTPGFYVIFNNADSLWWKENEAEIRAIFSTLHIANGIIFREEALSIAKKDAVGEYKRQYGEFDCESGIWSFVFESAEKSQIIKIDKNGNKI